MFKVLPSDVLRSDEFDWLVNIAGQRIMAQWEEKKAEAEAAAMKKK